MRPMRSARPLTVAAMLYLFAAACGGTESTPPPPPDGRTPATVAVSAGNGQQVAAGEAVPVAPAVVVRDASGDPVAGVAVTFAVADGGGQLQGATPTTNASGVAAVTRWTLGPSGAQRLTATVGSLPAVEFQATITPGTQQYVGTIGGAGGTIRITDPASPFDGLALTAPAGTFSASTSWRLRTGSLSPKFTAPSGFTVAGPPLVVETSAGWGEKLMTLEVPVNAAPGARVFLALHDPVRGTSELLTVVDRKPNAVVVATRHLRGDLLPGGTAGATLRDGSAGVANEELSQVIPLLEGVMQNVQTELNKWAVADMGTARHPDGVGAGLSLLQFVASKPGVPRFNLFVKAAPTPGFYMEPGPLAAAEISQQAMQAQVGQAVSQLQAYYANKSETERNRLVHENVVAWMRFSQRPALVGFLQEQGKPPSATVVTAGSADDWTAAHPCADQPVTAPAGMVWYAPCIFLSGGPMPMNGSVLDFAPIETLVSELVKMAQGGSARDAANETLAAQAGLPTLATEIRNLPNAAWVTTELQRIIARKETAEFRILGHKITVHLPDGTEVGRSEGEPALLVQEAALAEGAEVLRTISSYVEGIDGVLRQVTVAVAKMGYAPFEVAPEEEIITADDLGVAFEGSVQLPPEGGFRIRWDWGDGETSNNLGLTNGTHTYDALGEYTVVATLLAAADGRELAVDTVMVRETPSAWVGEVTSTLVNSNPNAQHTITINATGVRFIPEFSDLGEVLYRIAAGNLTIVNNVPCANYVSPVVQVDLATQGGPAYQWLLTLSEDPSAPPGTTGDRGLWYAGGGSANGFQILTRDCITAQNPSPQTYVHATATAWFRTIPVAASPIPYREAPNTNVIEGTFTEQDGTVTQTWTWRFERVND